MTFDKILFSPVQPGHIDVAWAKPVKGGFALYLNFNGKWQPQIMMNDAGTDSPDDDIPWEGGGGQPGPDTVGTEQIINNSVTMDDLNEEVKDKLDHAYEEEDEALYIDGAKPKEE